MNYNDIEERLKKVYASIEGQYLYGIDALDAAHYDESEGGIIISFNNPKIEPKILNQINNIIANLANIKDCLIKILEQRGEDKQLIENEINNCLDLQLVVDLANQEKHGCPLKERRRSKKDPKIINFQTALTPSNKPDNTVVQRPDGSSLKNMMIIIHADIVDANGNLLCRLDELISNAIGAWENIIKKYNTT